MSFDAIVVGCGVAGLSAAVAAPESGAKVAVLERSTFEERGGNTRYTTAAVRMKNEDAVADDFEQRFTDNSGYQVSPDLIEATVLDYDNWPGLVRTAPFTGPDLIAFFAEQAPLTIAWLKSRGVHFGGIGFYGLTPRSSPRIAITGGGLHLVEVMTERAVALGVEFFYQTCARELIRGVAGVVARAPDDKPPTAIRSRASTPRARRSGSITAAIPARPRCCAGPCSAARLARTPRPQRADRKTERCDPSLTGFGVLTWFGLRAPASMRIAQEVRPA